MNLSLCYIMTKYWIFLSTCFLSIFRLCISFWNWLVYLSLCTSVFEWLLPKLTTISAFFTQKLKCMRSNQWSLSISSKKRNTKPMLTERKQVLVIIQCTIRCSSHFKRPDILGIYSTGLFGNSLWNLQPILSENISFLHLFSVQCKLMESYWRLQSQTSQ